MFKSNEMLSRKQRAERIGKLAETIARFVYLFQGYRLCESRYKTPVGEIDLVLRRGQVIVFLEVKYRQRTKDALESLQPHQIERIRKAASWYLMKNQKYALRDLRFDFIVISKWTIKILKNAF